MILEGYWIEIKFTRFHFLSKKFDLKNQEL